MDAASPNPTALRYPVTDADRAVALASALMSGVDLNRARDVLTRSAVLELPAGTTLLGPGDHNSSLFLVASGRLLVYLEEPAGRHYLALETGDCVGEVSFLDGRPASAHVLSSTDCRVLEIGADDVWSLINDTSEFARNLLRVLAIRVRNDNNQLLRSFNLQREYERAAKTDLLTGVHNRRWMTEMFPRQLARSEFSGHPAAVLMVDIDHFKRLNDTYGHVIGDVVLKAVARRLSDTLRPTDFLVRYGGEEFIALLPGATQEAAAIAGERLRRAVADAQYHVSEPTLALRVTVSIGIAMLQPGEALDTLIDRADVALYRAKAGGRNTVECDNSGAPSALPATASRER